MAKTVLLQHKDSGVTRTGYYGFSWTTLFFGFFPALFRSDYITFIGGFVVYALLAIISFGILPLIASVIWAFIYNKYYTTRLLERGYVFMYEDANTAEAKIRLGIAATKPSGV